MFLLPGVIFLNILIYVKPQEFIPVLQQVPILYLTLAFAVFGFIVDLKLRLIRLNSSPYLKWVLLLLAWSILTVLIKQPDAVVDVIIELFITLVPYFIIAHGIQSFRKLSIIAGMMWGLTLLISIVGVHQHFQRFECVAFAGSIPMENRPSRNGIIADGETCDPLHGVSDCMSVYTPEPGILYGCEQRGLFGTTSIGEGRIRYRGKLQDPNEVGMVVATGLPFAILLWQIKPTHLRFFSMLITAVLVVMCIKFTGSRGALLVFFAVLGVFSYKKWGNQVLIIGAIIGLPVFAVMSGAKRADADASKAERIELQAAGLEIWQRNPIMGVGFGQYLKHHHLTTHNSYVLVLAEIGIVGTFLWLVLLYMTVKIAFKSWLHYRDRRGERIVDIWSTALVSSMGGMAIGIFFLSFYSHFVLWILLGINGAYNAAIEGHDPNWKMSFTVSDRTLLIGGAIAMPIVLKIFIMVMG